MKSRILDGVGVALVLASMAVAVATKPEPKPTVAVYSICSDDSIPWIFKLDCLWSN